MALRINQSGTYRNTTSLRVNQSGTYRTIVNGCINQSGTYRCFGMSAPSGSISVSPSSYVRANNTSATLTWSSTKATSVASSTNFSTSSTGSSITVSPCATTTFSIVFRNAFADSSTFSTTLTTTVPALGSDFQCGKLICNQGTSTRWVISVFSAQVSRTWYSRNDAITRAQQVSGGSGWFIPSGPQMRNPGYVCRTYWGGSSNFRYWTSSDGGHPNYGMAFRFADGNQLHGLYKNAPSCVRAFRCITY
jgi:hypothetical protein